jgi:biopolymer transport protein ExbD
VTVRQARSRFRRELAKAEEAEEEAGEINLVPYLDIVVNVIMFLLATITQVVAMGNINVSSPGYAEAAPTEVAQPSEQEDKPKLNLNVTVSDTGFIIAGSGGVLYENDVPGRLPTIPKRGGDYDFYRLTETMTKLKTAFPDENVAILGANAGIPYETVVRTMDAVRERPGKRCTQACRDRGKTPQECPPDDLQYTGDCLFPEVLLSAGVE